MTYATYIKRVNDDVAKKPGLNDGVSTPWQQIAAESVEICRKMEAELGMTESELATHLMADWAKIVVPNRASLMDQLHDAYAVGKQKSERQRKGQRSIFDLLT